MLRLLIILGWFVLFGCKDTYSNDTPNPGNSEVEVELNDLKLGDEIEVPRTSEVPAPRDIHDAPKGRKIIKEGHLTLEVKDLNASKHMIDSLLKSTSGYYENEQYESSYNNISYTLTLRIPSVKFDLLVTDLEKNVGKLKTKNIITDDVTEEYTDQNIRLDNNLSYLMQYRDILKMAKTINEILEVQERIRQIEEEIDSKKGRLKYLDDRENFSTLHLQIVEYIVQNISSSPNIFNRMINALRNGFEGSIDVLIGLMNFWPIVFVVAILYFVKRYRFQKK